MKCLFFHKWEYIKETFIDSYLGIQYTNYYNKWRHCKKCGIVQELKTDRDGKKRWITLSDIQANIVINKKVYSYHLLKDDKNNVIDERINILSGKIDDIIANINMIKKEIKSIKKK